jgi:hypothetical protein
MKIRDTIEPNLTLNQPIEWLADVALLLEENPREFIKTYGMKMCSLIFLGVNFHFMHKGIMDPEHVNLIRNFIAAPLQIAFGINQLNGQKKEGYDWGVGGGSAHVTANLQEDMLFNAGSWGVFTEAAYKDSYWPERANKFAAKHPLLAEGFHATKQDILELPLIKAATYLPRKTIEFVGNQFDLLKDPHARAGTATFIMTIGQWIEAAMSHNDQLLPVMPFWMIATSFYMGHGLLHAHDKKQAAQNTALPH